MHRDFRKINKMKRLMMTLLLAALTMTASLQAQPQWPEASRQAKAGSRWWWHGSAVDKENLLWQMQQLAEAGIGNLEITPIYGVKGNTANNIAFLSSQWLEMLDYVQQQGDLLGIDIDMTTGTGWPCGGPMVKLAESASRLVTETHDISGDGSTVQTVTLTTSGATLQKVMAFPQSGNTGSVTDITDKATGTKLQWTAPEGAWKVIAAYNQYGVMQVKRPSPGSEGYVVDYFDKTAVANYLKYFDNRFNANGSRWPHSFFNDSYEINQADWTPTMFETFEKLRGYKLEEKLDKFLDRDPQVYADYRQTLSDMLRDNFTRQWTQWAHSHGATARNQAHGSPGNLIDLYAEADIPETESFYMNNFGIRGLRDDKGFYMQALSSRATLKYASSAAHITGKTLTSSESMTWLTEHFRTSLSQIKPELDLLFTSGINHVMFHGTTYSPKDAAWPGWKFYAAVDMSPTNSIWQDAPAMMKYIERVQSFMQMGQPDNDVLVYAPFANAMHKNSGTDYQNRMALFNINTLSTKMAELEECVNNLEKMGLDCDYTSEYYLMHTTYNDGALQTAAGTRYKALVLPVSTNLPDSVAAHIEELRQQGCPIVEGRTATALSALTMDAEQMRSDMGLSVIRRKNDSGHHYFVSNLTPADAEGYVALGVPFQSVAIFDPMTGSIKGAAIKDGKVWISLKSGQSALLWAYDSKTETAGEVTPSQELTALVIDTPWTLTVDGQLFALDKLRGWETLSDATAKFMGTGSYETTFSVTAAQLKSASAGFRLSLGDVRESARLWLNDEYLGCLWAVPFCIDIAADKLHEGSNTLRIEVTNLPANKISSMDREGTVWRIFEDINMSNISSDNYGSWQPVPSGLCSKVELIPLAAESNTLKAEFYAMESDAQGNYYPAYAIEMPAGATAEDIALTDENGNAFNGYSLATAADGTVRLTVKGLLAGNAIVTVGSSDGQQHYCYLPANGAYKQLAYYDFKDEGAMNNQWSKMATTVAITGFSGSGKQAWYRSKASTTSNAVAFEGLTLTADKNTYYCIYPNYGLNAFNDFTMTVNDAEKGDIALISYLIGDGASTYSAADSLLTIAYKADDYEPLAMSLTGRNGYVIYRELTVYRQQQTATAISQAATGRRDAAGAYYTLQGVRVVKPRKGIYIRNGKKLIFQ